MKKLSLLWMILAVMCCVVFAAEKGDETVVAGAVGVALERPTLTDDYAITKTRYYELYDRIEAFTASNAELTEMSDLCQVWLFDLPPSMRPVEESERTLDQGSGDCNAPTVITSCPASYTGFFDGDNDCSVPAVSPSNEVFYTFTPTVTGNYQFRVRSGSGTVPAIRVLSGSCCTGGTSVAFSSSSVATDCGETVTIVTYARATLTAGVQYWIHVGTSTTTIYTSAYDFQIYCVPCPPRESSVLHNTCETAQVIACNDSLIGDSAFTTAPSSPDWYRFTINEWDSVYIFVGGRELGHCNSGLYPGSTSIDGRYTLFNITNGCPGDSIRRVDDEGCSLDAIYGFRLAPGTYAIKVWNYSALEYVLTTRCFPTTPPLDCNTYLPCGTPAEIEPNNICTSTSILPVGDCGQNVYGTICPDSDLDLWYVPATAPGQILTVSIYDGMNCMTYPPTSAGLRIATSATFTCLVPTGTSYFAGFIFGGCQVWPGGWIAVSRFAGSETKYRLESTCTTYECPCPAPTEPMTVQQCQPCAGPIVDVATVAYTQNITGEYRITDLNVCVDITHTYDGDLQMTLVTPWGDSLTLVNRRGSSGDNFRVTTFDDEAAISIVAGTPPYNGSFQPEEALSAADGYYANGNWQLVIRDWATGDVGYVHCWCLRFTYDQIRCEFPYEAVDMGDLSACNYPTLVGNPAHGLSNIAWLGTGITGEPAPNSFDVDPFDDGVTFHAFPWDPCTPEVVTVVVTAGPNYARYADCGGQLYLNAWKDGNLDGDFCDELCPDATGAPAASEWIIQDVPVLPASLTFTVMDPGVSYLGIYDGVFRFRLTSQPVGRFGFGLLDAINCPQSTCGTFAFDFLGEVEDYFFADFQLDVELTSFDAAVSGDNIALRWVTASENGNDHFEITRNGDLVASIASQGDGATSRSYTWADSRVVLGGVYTYALIAVDVNGNREELATRTVTMSAEFSGVVTEYALHQNYPNPFNPVTNIAFDLVEAGHVTLTLYNVNGQQVGVPVNSSLGAGRHVIAFDAAGLPSGLYLYRLDVNGFTAQKKMLLMK